ncbi:nucleotidyl transferase AbiEii/AbiGii toxin family protein [Acidobacteria bacterium AH-259-O06]|nr:nucleotidyl transferase AbiEii/AbiGii toxin family protein [Acidobacteria bacterium AH-259-O06]
MAKQIELMERREQRIAELVKRLREKSNNYKKPAIIMIGGYALRDYVPFARYSRDCDFAVKKSRAWTIDRIEKWFPGLGVEAKKKSKSFGYLRMIELVQAGKRKIKIALDFMEGEILGRSGEAFLIDERFISESVESTIQIGREQLPIRVPSYQDYFLLKLLSGRASDVRDIAALVWKKDLPEFQQLIARAKEVVKEPEILSEKLKLAIADISHPSFLDSWRGTFITEEFTDKAKGQVLRKLQQLKRKWASNKDNE